MRPKQRGYCIGLVVGLISAPMNLSAYLATSSVTQAEFAQKVGVTQGRVSQWIRGAVIPAERCRAIEAATEGKVTVHDLRPDIFGPSADRAA